MLGRREPLLHRRTERFDGHTGVSRDEDGAEIRHRKASHGLLIPSEHELERGRRFPFRMLRGQGDQPVERKDELRVHRMLDPKRSVLVERDETFRRRHEFWTGLVGRRPDEFAYRRASAARRSTRATGRPPPAGPAHGPFHRATPGPTARLPLGSFASTCPVARYVQLREDAVRAENWFPRDREPTETCRQFTPASSYSEIGHLPRAGRKKRFPHPRALP